MDYGQRMQRVDERLGAVSESLELLTADVHELQGIVRQRSEGIGKLLRVAEIRHERISRLEGGQA